MRQIAALKEMVKRGQAEVRKLQNTVSSLHGSKDAYTPHSVQSMLAEKDKKIHYLKETQSLYQQAQERVQRLEIELKGEKEEIQNLQIQMEMLKDSYKEIESAHLTQEGSLLQLREERDSFYSLFEEKRGEIDTLHREMKQMQQAAQDAEARHQALVKEKIDLVEQMEKVRSQLSERKEEMKAQSEQHRQAKEEIEQLKEQISHLEQHLVEAQRKQCLLQNSLSESRREREVAVESKVALESEIDRLRQEQTELNRGLQKTLEEREEKIYALQERAEKRAKELKEELRVKEELIEDLHSIKELAEHLQIELNSKAEIAENLDNELKTAQYHLAKKVKEATRLEEQVEELTGQMRRSESASEQQKRYLLDLENESQSQHLREQELQNRLEKEISAIESKAAYWEEQYLRVHTKLQQNEASSRHLYAIEDKCRQISTILADILQTSKSPTKDLQLDLFSPLPKKQIKKDLFDS